METNNQLLTSVLNALDDIFVVYENDTLTYCNDAFLKFFYVDSLDTFKTVYSSIEETFMYRSSFFHKGLLEEGESWIDYMSKETAKNRVVIMLRKSDFEPRAFVVKVTHIDSSDNKVLISFTDITELTIEDKKNEYNLIYDSLTNIYSRNKFNEILDDKIKLSNKFNLPLTLILLDIDFFKVINDTFEVTAGDNVLSEMAKLISNNIRRTDIFARWGGEEFIILAPLIPLENARLFAEKLRTLIENYDFNDVGKLTCSFGVTEYQIGETEYKLLSRLDKALCDAKDAGRNIVIVKSGEE